MTSIFTKIINREAPAHFLYEDDVCIAILDIAPAVPGQTLVIPKQPTDYIFDLDETTYQHIFSVAKTLARAADKAFGAERTCLVVEGFDVPHVHIKLFPLKDTLTPLGKVMQQGALATDADLAVAATQLQAALEDKNEA